MGTGPPQHADDPLPALVGFTAVLRHAGLAITTDRVAAFLQALDALDVASEAQTYWAGRLTLCADPDDIPRYDLAFGEWFARDKGRLGTRMRDERPPPPPKLAALVAPREASSGDGDADGQELHARASGAEILRHRDVGDLSPSEREHLRQLLALLRPDPPTRPSRRLRPHRRAACALGPAAAARAAGAGARARTG